MAENKKHFNLYYVFAEDKAANRMPAARLAEIKSRIFKKTKPT